MSPAFKRLAIAMMVEVAHHLTPLDLYILEIRVILVVDDVQILIWTFL
jgi:hypothetical protein